MDAANRMARAASLPEVTGRADMRHQQVAWFIDNAHVACDAVMQPFARGVLAMAAGRDRRVRQVGVARSLQRAKPTGAHPQHQPRRIGSTWKADPGRPALANPGPFTFNSLEDT